MPSYTLVISSPISKLGIQLVNEQLSRIDFLAADTPEIAPSSSFQKKIATQLKQYFQNPHHTFDLPLLLNGTPFQQRVWKALRKIKTGTTLSYGKLAEQLSSSAQAVGNACRANPLPIIIPCHRIVAATHIGGYSGAIVGDLLKMKQWLLNHEETACD
jgi:methylated-DNA-[protein]-cysteine S-methyltransferase